MPKSTAEERYSYTQNRELSWLRFNRRVLEAAADTETPLLERLKFISIFSSNLDEFFMVRVGSLVDISQVSPEEKDNKTGMTAQQQLERIYGTIPGLLELKNQIYHHLLAKLAEEGIEDVTYDALSGEEQKFIQNYFKSNILPIISPMVIGNHHPVPHLANKKLYIVVSLRDKKEKFSLGVIPMPNGVAPYVALPGKNTRWIRMENILLHLAPTLFSDYRIEEACVICVTRNADISFDHEKFEDDTEEDFRSRMTKMLKKRDSLSVVRLEINQDISDFFYSKLIDLIHINRNQVYIDHCPLKMGYVYSLQDLIDAEKVKHFLYQPHIPRWPEDIDPKVSMIDQIQTKDKMLFYPFDSVQPFLNLLQEAAEREDVLSIKITIYRLASFSKIARMLCRAAENGKEVIVLMELRARFDEANNISWSKLLEDAGCRVIYGVEDYKCHSKVCIITMKKRGVIRYITQIGTGNYNEKTNTMYTDLSIMTASDAIGKDATAFFQNMLISKLDGTYQELLVAPYGIKPQILSLIEEEMKKGRDGYICMKANSVTEREVIDKLMEASCAGVEIRLIIRGICCILPGVPGYTENVHVCSIVGRFLEHARIYCFGRGDQAKVYISSADLMTRNLNRRVEIACPVYDEDLRQKLMKILDCELRDNVKAAFMMSDGQYSKKHNQLPEKIDSQEYFRTHTIHTVAQTQPKQKSWLEKLMNIFSRKNNSHEKNEK